MFQEHSRDQRSSIFNDFQMDILTIFERLSVYFNYVYLLSTSSAILNLFFATVSLS